MFFLKQYLKILNALPLFFRNVANESVHLEYSVEILVGYIHVEFPSNWFVNGNFIQFRNL